MADEVGKPPTLESDTTMALEERDSATAVGQKLPAGMTTAGENHESNTVAEATASIKNYIAGRFKNEKHDSTDVKKIQHDITAAGQKLPAGMTTDCENPNQDTSGSHNEMMETLETAKSVENWNTIENEENDDDDDEYIEDDDEDKEDDEKRDDDDSYGGMRPTTDDGTGLNLQGTEVFTANNFSADNEITMTDALDMKNWLV